VERIAESTVFIVLPVQFGFEHGKVICHDESNFLLGPITGVIGILDRVPLSLPENCEAQLSEYEVGLPRSFPAAEFLGQQDSPEEVAAR
jgi:hypothetical protein